MRLTHHDYIKLVVGAYNSKRAKNDLSGLLVHPSYYKIKRECQVVFKKRYDKKDEQALRNFFDINETGGNLSQLINGFDPDKFRPLVNYLKESTEKTDYKNIELLAWLIDFQHRPWVQEKQVVLSDEELSMLEEDDPVPGPEETGNPTPGKKPVPPKVIDDELPDVNTVSTKNAIKVTYKRALLILLVLIITAGGTFSIWQNSKDRGMKMGDAMTGCMYWADDHYEKVPCNEDMKGRLFLPLNEERQENFKRIIDEATITEQLVGKVYYIKRDGNIEYFTSGGNHPVEVTRSLKILSQYMFDKYLRKKDSLANDNLPDSNLKLTSNQ